jgi:PAS domain S-box-containing protein
MNDGKIVYPRSRGVTFVSLVLAALLLGSAGITYWAGIRVAEDSRRLVALRTQIEWLERLLSTVKDAETGQRGYLLTGKNAYLEPYQAAVVTLRHELGELSALGTHGDFPQQWVAQVNGLVAEKMAELEQTIKDYRGRHPEAALAIVLTDRGKQVMDELRSAVDGMRSEKQVEFARVSQVGQTSNALRTVIFVVVTILNLAFLAWAYRRIALEIGFREAAIAETRRQKDLLATTLASIGDGVIVTDTEARITFMNGVAASLTGWTADEARGNNITDVFQIINQVTRAPVENPVHHVLRSGLIAGLANHTLLICRDGREIAVDDSGAPIRPAGGETCGVVLVFRDITERHRAEEYIQALMKALPVGVSFSNDPSCRFITGNPAVLSQFEVQPEDNLSASAAEQDAAGRRIRFFKEGREISDSELPLQRAVAGKAAIPPEELDVLLPSGRRWFASASAAPIFDPQGKVIGGVAVTLDITDRKRAEESIRVLTQLAEQKAAQAQAANEAKSRFVANVSHELRTPMNAILGMIDLALRKNLDATTRDYLSTARDSADVLLSLLNDLLDSAKIESGNLQLEATPLRLRAMLRQVTRTLSVRASEKGLVFDCQVSGDVPDALIGDKVRLRQVLMNLAGNAIKFTERGEVTLSVRTQSLAGTEACLEFAVRDTGIGISASDLERIFKPFAQADSSTARRFGGTGLGLSISANLISLMGGRLWAESEPGQGSTFIFTVSFPLGDEQGAEEEPSGDLPAATRRPLNVLLVEDNPANQKVATYILEAAGHTVDVASDGQQALRMSAADRHDVILMDVQMPGMDGLQTTGAIRARESGRRVPVIAMTAHAMSGDRERCHAAGMDGYLSKPIDAREMFTLIENLTACSSDCPGAPHGSSSSGANAGGMPADVFDLEQALKRCFDSREMLREMVDCLFSEAERLMPQMRVALPHDNSEELGRLAHRLKGTLLYLGARQSTDAAVAVEDCCRGPKDVAERAVADLEIAIERLKLALTDYRGQ